MGTQTERHRKYKHSAAIANVTEYAIVATASEVISVRGVMLPHNMSVMTSGSEKIATASTDVVTMEPANSPRDHTNGDSLEVHAALRRERRETRAGGGSERVCTRKNTISAAMKLHMPKYKMEAIDTGGSVNSADDASRTADDAAPVLANNSKAPGADVAT